MCNTTGLRQQMETSRRPSKVEKQKPMKGAVRKVFRQLSKLSHNLSETSKRSPILQKWNEIRTNPGFLILSALAGLIVPPLVLYNGIPTTDPRELIGYLGVVWTGFLHLDVKPVIVYTILCTVLFARECREEPREEKLKCDVRKFKCCRRRRVPLISFCIMTVGLVVLEAVHSQVQMFVPSWIWNPFLWGRYHVYESNKIEPALQGLCLDDTAAAAASSSKKPLCLSKKSWKILSAEGLDPTNPQDVHDVSRGIEYVQNMSGGLIINVMSRDTIEAIPHLRRNVEGLVPFFQDKLAVVVFENDSKDGSRDAFKQWAKEAQGYRVDVMSCGEDYPDCRFGISHRYDATEEKDYFKSSAIGRMAEFRQRMVDYIVEEPYYKDYSHMVVYDLDLKVSFSPLGILHTLGILPDDIVASSGRQTWPGSWGTIVPPYDFSAFRPIETEYTRNMLRLQKGFCEILPAGDRWRNLCDAPSPMMLAMTLKQDKLDSPEPYQVVSAYNGATMYPLKLIREEKPQYDVGDDGQRCEHVGFNLSFSRHMFVNPKWTFHVSPNNPGGPTGARAFKSVARIVFLPQLGIVIFLITLSSMLLMVTSIMLLTLNVGFPVIYMLERMLFRRLKDDDSDVVLPLLSSDVSDTSSEDSDSQASAPPRRGISLSRRSPIMVAKAV